MKNVLAIIVCLVVGMVNSSQAQVSVNISPRETKDPTTWKYEVKKLDRNEYELIFHVELEKGWHIFSQNPGDSSLIAPSFTFDENGSIRRLGALREKGKLIETTFEGFDSKLRYFEGKVEFIQKIAYQGARAVITGEHQYQICNDRMCLPPTSKKFEFLTTKS